MVRRSHHARHRLRDAARRRTARAAPCVQPAPRSPTAPAGPLCARAAAPSVPGRPAPRESAARRVAGRTAQGCVARARRTRARRVAGREGSVVDARVLARGPRGAAGSTPPLPYRAEPRTALPSRHLRARRSPNGVRVAQVPRRHRLVQPPVRTAALAPWGGPARPPPRPGLAPVGVWPSLVWSEYADPSQARTTAGPPRRA